MTLQPAPIRVPLLDSNGRPSQEWVRWFNEISQVSATIPTLEPTTASLTALELAQAALAAQLAALEGELTEPQFLTNSRLNGNQQNLNLIAGSNVALTEDGNGNVLIAATGSSSVTLPIKADEVPAGTMDGINKVFTISDSPDANSFRLKLNGVDQDELLDYTRSGVTITYRIAPKATDSQRAFYTHS